MRKIRMNGESVTIWCRLNNGHKGKVTVCYLSWQHGGSWYDIKDLKTGEYIERGRQCDPTEINAALDRHVNRQKDAP